MIRRTGNHIRHSLTAQLCLWVVGFVIVLSAASLFIMFHYARQGIYREAMEKARQTLRTTELRIDNTALRVQGCLAEVETSTRNYFVHPDTTKLAVGST